MAIKKAKVFSITSVKGGTGKTTTTLNLAGIFEKLGKKVLIIDLDLYSGSIAASLNISNETDLYRLIDDMNNNRFDNLENYVVKYDDYIDVIPAVKDPRNASKVNPKYVSIVLARASMNYDVILIDTNHIMNDLNLVALDYSDEILYIITNDPIDLKNMKTMVVIYKDMDKNNYKIILNESINKNRSFYNKYDIKNIIKDNVDYTIPSSFNIKNIDKFVLDGQILTLSKKIKNKQAIKNFNMLANSLIKDKNKNDCNQKNNDLKKRLESYKDSKEKIEKK